MLDNSLKWFFKQTHYWWWWGHMRTIIMLESWFRSRLLLRNGGHNWATWDQTTHLSGFLSAPHRSNWPPLSGQIRNHLSFFFHVLFCMLFPCFFMFLFIAFSVFPCCCMFFHVFFLRIPQRFINLWSKISASTHPNGQGEGKGPGVHWRTCSTRRCHQKKGPDFGAWKAVNISIVRMCVLFREVFIAIVYIFVIYPSPLVFKLKR